MKPKDVDKFDFNFDFIDTISNIDIYLNIHNLQCRLFK